MFGGFRNDPFFGYVLDCFFHLSFINRKMCFIIEIYQTWTHL